LISLIAEQPIVVSIMLGLVGLGLVYGWLQTGKTATAICGLIALLLIPVAFYVASIWVTDREQIRQVVFDAAGAVQSNEPEKAVELIASDQYRQQAIGLLRGLHFDRAVVTGEREIRVDSQTFPPTAVVDINVRVEATNRFTVLRRLILDFEKIDGQWKVVSYEHLDPINGRDQYSNLKLPP
jgi:hypothetical protein